MALLSFLKAARPHAGSPHAPIDPPANGVPLAHPSADPGIAVKGTDDILAAHEDLLSRIKLCYGADRGTFEADLLVPIRNFAAYVNLLPATADNFFCEVGGLFRLGLEVGFYALQGTDGHIVSGRATISSRRHLEPRWRHATFLAGLCCEVHRALSEVVVTDERGDEWPAYLGPLTTWLAARRSKRFFIRWLTGAQESRALGLFALPYVVPADTLQHLANGNTIAVPQLLASLASIPSCRNPNILVDLVKRATALVINRNLLANANRYGRPILGAHVERYLLDAMRRLVTSHSAWTPNQERSRVWHGQDGLFIVWPNAVTEIRKLLEEDALPGIPKAPETILEILLGAGVLKPRSADQALWTIAPPPGKSVVEAVRLSSPEILLPSYSDLAAPLAVALIVRDTGAKPGIAQLSADSPAAPLDNAITVATGATVATPTAASATPAQNLATASSNVCVTEDGEILPGSAPAQAASPAPTADAQINLEFERLPARIPFKLAAPMRLNPGVRDALALAIDSMNGHARNAVAITVPAGVFVPLNHFKQAHLDLPVVLRSLGEMSMLCGGSGNRPTTVQHELGGEKVIGFVLKPGFVQGLDPADFADSPKER